MPKTVRSLTREQGIFERLFAIIGILNGRNFDCKTLEENTKNSERLLMDLDINTLWLIVSNLLTQGLGSSMNEIESAKE